MAAPEQYLTHSSLHNTPLEDDTKDWRPSSAPTDINQTGGFDCNICLDMVQDPVVTVCGHLYCWPCIYKWIHQQSVAPDAPLDHQPQCPVCKAEVSEKTLIPLYGRGQAVTESDDKAAPFGAIIPHRPNSPRYGSVQALVSTSTTTTTTTTQQDSQHHHGFPPYPPQPEAYDPDYGDYSYTSAAPAIRLAGTTTFHPMISMFGEMICTRLFGHSQPFYTYPNSYGMAAAGNTRVRRRVMQADQSLSRISVFMWCCLILCLVFF